MSSETTPPITVEQPIKTTIGTIIAIVTVAAAGVAAWTYVRADVAQHSRTLEVHERRLASVEDKIASDHDILIEIRSDLKALRREKGQ